jgi:DNA-binding Lrp family transcriptional regulator
MTSQEKKQEILRLLRRNARIPDQEIADRLGVEVAEVNAVIAQLEKDRLVLGYSAVIADGATGDDEVSAIIEVEVQPERDGGFDRIAENLSHFPEVRSAYLVSGRYDLRLSVVGRSLQEVAHFVASKLASQPGVRATATHFMLKTYKEAGIQFHEDENYERLKVVP